MKRALRLPLCLLLTVSLIGSCALAGFVPVREAQSFSDVPASHWSYSYVQQCDRLGLMGGTGEDRFSPSGTLQAAEAVTVCVRLRDLYDGGGRDNLPGGGALVRRGSGAGLGAGNSHPGPV